MKNLFFLLIVFTILLCLVSCFKPDENVRRVSLFDFIRESVNIFYSIKDDYEKQLKFSEDLKNLEILIEGRKNQKIVISSFEINRNNEQYFIKSLNNNNFITLKDIYITNLKNVLFFSFDNKNWYTSRTDLKNKIENVFNDFEIRTKVEGNTIYIDYSSNLKNGRFIVKSNENFSNRTLFYLDKNMVLNHSKKEKVTVDLEKNILFIPKDTILTGKINVKGNIIEANNDEKSLNITIKENFFLYIKNRLFSISFDNINWNNSLLSFKIAQEIEVYSVDKNVITFNGQVTFIYNR